MSKSRHVHILDELHVLVNSSPDIFPDGATFDTNFVVLNYRSCAVCLYHAPECSDGRDGKVCTFRCVCTFSVRRDSVASHGEIPAHTDEVSELVLADSIFEELFPVNAPFDQVRSCLQNVVLGLVRHC